MWKHVRDDYYYSDAKTKILTALLLVTMQSAAEVALEHLRLSCDNDHTNDDNIFDDLSFSSANQQRKKFFRELISESSSSLSSSKKDHHHQDFNFLIKARKNVSDNDNESLMFLSLEIVSRFVASQQMHQHHRQNGIVKSLMLVIEHAMFFETALNHGNNSSSSSSSALCVAKTAIELLLSSSLSVDDESALFDESDRKVSSLIENSVLLGIPQFGSEILKHYYEEKKRSLSTTLVTTTIRNLSSSASLSASASSSWNNTNLHHLLRKTKYHRLRNHLLVVGNAKTRFIFCCNTFESSSTGNFEISSSEYD